MLRRLVLVLLVGGLALYLVAACRPTQPNQPPEVALRSDFTARLGHLVPVVASASDADGDALDYRWELLSTPDGAAPTLDTEGGHVVVLSADTAGEYELRVVVDDGQATASDAVVITFDPDFELDPWAAMSASPYVIPEIASVYLPDPATGDPVLTEVAVLAGFVVQGGDLVLGRLEDFDGVAPSSFVRESAKFPSSEIPYEFEEDEYSEAAIADVRSALAVLAAETGVLTFTDVTGQGFEGPRIRFIRTSVSVLEGCWATQIPLIWPEVRVVNLGAGCLNERTIKHEVLHALGFMHEHQRLDRDNYVEVTRVAPVWDLEAQYLYVLNFSPTSDGIASTSYDWHSIMHYPFAVSFGWFLSPKDGALPDDETFYDVGWLTPLSAGDIEAVRNMYGPGSARGSWVRRGFDLEGSRHHPSVATVPSSGAPDERWRYTFANVTSEHVLAGDVTGDGDIHLVTAQNGTLYVLRQDGTVKRQMNVSTGSGSAPHAYMLEDINGDGALDIGVGYSRHGTYGINEARVYSEPGAILHEIRRSGSFDGQGMMPITVVDGDMIVAESAGYAGQPRGFSRWNLATGSLVWTYSLGPNYHGHSAADIDGDGKLEFSYSTGTPNNGVTANGTNDSNTYTVIVNEDGANRLTQLYPYHANTSDSLLEAFVRFRSTEPHQLVSFKTHEPPYTGTSRVHVRQLDGTILHTYVGLANARWTFGWADLDRDGVAEIVAANWSQLAATLTVFDRYLAPQASLSLASGPQLPVVRAIADLDGDGYPDILVSRGTTLTAFDRQLTPMWEWTSDVGGISNVIVSDLNGNGRLDIVILSGSALVVLE